MDNEIRKYCEQCKFYSVLGCQSTLICTNGNKFWAAYVQPISQWISVDEALPEKDGYYLVVTQGIHNPTIDIAGFWHYAEWVQKEIRENYWNKYDKVLYWQPLPELPEAI